MTSIEVFHAGPSFQKAGNSRDEYASTIMLFQLEFDPVYVPGTSTRAL